MTGTPHDVLRPGSTISEPGEPSMAIDDPLTVGRASIDSPDRDVAEVAAALGSALVAATPVGWGDARSTLRVLLFDGRIYAVRRLPGRDPTIARRIASHMRKFADAGLPTLQPVLTSTAEATWLSIPWVEGTTGAAWLGDPRRARHLADRMGRLVARFGRIDPVGASGDDHGAGEAIDELAATLDPGTTVRRAVTSAIRLRDAEMRGPSRLVHGDFAPINVIVGADGEIKALLDLEHARVATPLVDAAWWGWVVRRHHPEAWDAAWPTFRAAAGIGIETSDADLHALALLELVRRAAAAAAAADEEALGRWLDHLADAATWTFAVVGQPT